MRIRKGVLLVFRTSYPLNGGLQEGPLITHCQKANRSYSLDVYGLIERGCTCKAIWTLTSVRLCLSHYDCSFPALWARLTSLLGRDWHSDTKHTGLINDFYTWEENVKNCDDL
jgi:hypothetical protein